MKTKYLITAGVLAMLASIPARATTTYTDGDLFLGVLSDLGTTDYLIDISQGNAPFNFNTSFSVPIADLTADLNTAIGSGWATNPDVLFSVFGGTTSAPTTEQIYATNPNGSSNPWSTSTHEGSPASDLATIANDYVDNTSTLTNPEALEQTIGTSDNGSYGSFMPEGGNTESLDYFNPTIEGVVTSGLDFDYVPAGSNGTGTSLGTWTVDSATNSLNFVTNAVPEPSTVTAIAMGAATLLLAARRRRRA